MHFEIPHDDPCLAGHFPGRPLVPGVVLLERVLAAIEKGDLTAASSELSQFASVADKASKTKVLKKNTVSRLKSRLAQRLKKAALAKAAPAKA